MGAGLHTTSVGDPGIAGPTVVFLHGLFGQGRNWTGVAKAISTEHRSLLVDLPDHGRSPWSQHFDYLAMADDVAELVEDHGQGPVALVGHSMGGKVAMLVALRRLDLVERLCVVDVSPVATRARSDFEPLVAAMRSVDLGSLTRRSEAEEQMSAGVPDPVVRGFLLQNLRREGDGWRWQVNLPVLGDSLEAIGDWPETGPGTSYDGRVLWIAGAESSYVKAEYHDAMEALFPRVRTVTIKGAGHWVHSEQPAVFVEVLRRFLA